MHPSGEEPVDNVWRGGVHEKKSDWADVVSITLQEGKEILFLLPVERVVNSLRLPVDARGNA